MERDREKLETNRSQRGERDVYADTDTEFAQDAAVDRNFSDPESVSEERGDGFGIAAMILAVLSFFAWSWTFFLAPASIIAGVISVQRRNSLGWWAIGIAVVALIIRTIWGTATLPFRMFF